MYPGNRQSSCRVFALQYFAAALVGLRAITKAADKSALSLRACLIEPTPFLFRKTGRTRLYLVNSDPVKSQLVCVAIAIRQCLRVKSGIIQPTARNFPPSKIPTQKASIGSGPGGLQNPHGRPKTRARVLSVRRPWLYNPKTIRTIKQRLQ
jgi:hypothetical protein